MVSQSNSSDYYEEDNSQFLEALSKAILPGDILLEVDLAREKPDDDISSEELKPPPPSQPGLKRRWGDAPQEDLVPDATNQVSKGSIADDDTYGASRFGGFGDYMRRKRAKLQIQNSDIVEGSKNGATSQILKGLSIYVSLVFLI
jgi:DNA repair protein REV1